MSSSIYLFNPDYDMAMANFTPYYKAPAEIVRIAADFSVLPVWFAEPGCGIKVDQLERVELLARQLSETCQEEEGRCKWRQFVFHSVGRRNGYQLLFFRGDGRLVWFIAYGWREWKSSFFLLWSGCVRFVICLPVSVVWRCFRLFLVGREFVVR